MFVNKIGASRKSWDTFFFFIWIVLFDDREQKMERQKKMFSGARNNKWKSEENEDVEIFKVV